jgi:hypothetical protein
MPTKSLEARDAVSLEILEIGSSPKMVYMDDVPEVPVIPQGPAVLILDLGLPGVRHRQFGRLGDTVNALIRHESVPGVIEVSEPENFARAYHELLDSKTSALLYMPHELLHEGLARARSMLERLGYQPLDDVAPERSSSVATAPVATALEAARQRRAQLLEDEHWLDAGQVHYQQQGSDPSAPGANNTASRLRRRGELLGAWDGREYLHPACQFDHGTGRVMPEMKELLEILPKDRSGWRQAFWLFQPHALLDGRCPADAFQADPRSVIEAANSTFAPGNTNW